MSYFEDAKQKLIYSGESLDDDDYIIMETCDGDGNSHCFVNDLRGSGFKVKEPFLATIVDDALRIFYIKAKYSGYFENGSLLTLREFYVCE